MPPLVKSAPPLVALADQYKAAGYHIVTIAFDAAFSNTNINEILRQVASIDQLAPGAPAYSLLDQDLAENIVNLYLCPINPGSSATVYFDRDGAIDIIDIEVNGGCPNPDNIDITFSIESLQELSIPPGTPVTFYYNSPNLFGASPILTWMVPCAIPGGTTETYTVTLPVTGAASIFAALNDDSSESPPITFPITGIDELAWSNNISDTTICAEPLPTLQTLKYTTTPVPICNDIVMYTIDVCNITDLDATGVVVTDDPPDGFVLLNTVVNNNGCATDNSDSFDIPGGCCVSITITYDVGNAANGNYDNQDVLLSGVTDQVYQNFDGSNTAAEDVLIDGTVDCPSTIITFSKEVNVTNICEDAFVVYTFTIDNQLNVPLQGLLMTDILPTPVTWVFQPYNLHGLSISNSTFDGGDASFIIDEVQANTIATFSMDAALGDWVADGMLNNTATLENIPDLANGGIQTLTSNMVTTNVMAQPEIEVNQAFNCNDNTITLSAMINGQNNTAWSWITTGDGTFSDASIASTTYTLGNNELGNGETTLSVTGNTNCGEINEIVEVLINEGMEPISLNLEICEGETIDYAGTSLSAGDSQEFTFLNSIGCDSIVAVTVTGIAPTIESLTLEICEGETIDYNGTTLSPSDSQNFNFQSSVGCDSIVTVTVVGITPMTESLTLEVCEGETTNYNGTTFSAGDSQEFIFLSDSGCDSIVTVTTLGVPTTMESLNLQACEGETINYVGTTLSTGDSQEFVFQNSSGCDSIIEVTVLGVPSSNESIELEACPGVPVFYDGIPLSIGDEQIFTFENIHGCDSTIMVKVNGKGSSGSFGLPNVFSPNNDGINDCFKPYFANNLVFQSYQLQIFNRWGALLFSSNDPYTCWRGEFNNRPVDSGVYVWFIEATMEGCEGVSVAKGDVALIR